MADAAQPGVVQPDAAQLNVAQLLESLHPLREPPPPAPVLPYLAMLVAGVVLALGAAALLRLRRRRSLRAGATAMLAASRALSPPERLAAQATLLRRLVRAGGGEARAQGQAWLAALDRAFATDFFTAGQGRVFADGLYRRGPAVDLDAVDGALARLIARSPLRSPRGARAGGGR